MHDNKRSNKRPVPPSCDNWLQPLKAAPLGFLLAGLLLPLAAYAQGDAKTQASDDKTLDEVLGTPPSTSEGASSAASPADGPTEEAAAPSPVGAEKTMGAAEQNDAGVAAEGPDLRAKPHEQLEEIIVTATKREESQRKLPQTVDVLTGKNLEDIGARDLKDILSYVPGISMQDSNGNFQQLSIRGVGPQTSVLTANTTVGVLINDVPMSDPVGVSVPVDLDPYDLHDFEVLKGPQGTLFGASAEGGAIRYVLQKPLLGKWEAKGFTDWLHIQGAGSGMTYGAVVNVPVGDRAALRGVDVVQQTPGLYNDVNANGKNIRDADNGYKRSHRILGTWQPSETLVVDAMYLHQSSHTNDASAANNTTGSFTRTDTPGPSTYSTDIEMENVEARYRFDWATLVSSTSHLRKQNRFDIDAGSLVEQTATAGIESARDSLLFDNHTTIQELRLMSPDGSDSPWAWIGGAYYNRYVGKEIDNLYAANSGPLSSAVITAGLPLGLPPLVPSAQGLSAIYFAFNPLVGVEEALFGELTRKLFSNRVSVTIGGRIYREKLTENVIIGGVTYVTSAPTPGASGVEMMKAKGFNPKVSASWQVSDNVLCYANASHGFQFGGVNGPPLVPQNNFPFQYKPSTLWSYEAGVRTDLFENTLQIDVTPYLIHWKELQIQQSVPPTGGSYTDNVGAASVKGVEGSVRWVLPLSGFVFTTSGSYGHPKVAAPYTTASGQYVAPGSDLPQSPRLQTTSTLSYNVKFESVRTGAGVTWAHQGHAYNNITHDVPIYRYNTMALNYDLGLPYLVLSPDVTLNVTNVLNVHAISTSTADVTNTGTTYSSSFVRPRAINLRISGHF